MNPYESSDEEIVQAELVPEPHREPDWLTVLVIVSWIMAALAITYAVNS